MEQRRDTLQRYVLKTLIERADSPRLTAVFALGYWAALRISEVAQLQVDHCVLNQRAGTITLVGSKGGKTRTLDLHNQARRALNYPASFVDCYAYILPPGIRPIAALHWLTHHPHSAAPGRPTDAR